MSEMVARTGAVAAINGDFFPFTGDPLGFMIRDGKLLSTPNTRAVFGWGARNADMALVDFTGTVNLSGQDIALKGVNEDCPLNDIVLNTDVALFAMAKTPNIHAVIRMDNAEWSPNGTFTGTFETLFADAPKLPIQPGNAILTANGTKAELLKRLSSGDRITFRFETRGLDWSKIDQAIGGGPFLVRKGQVSIDAARQGFNDAFTNKRHPRTAMGKTSDGDIWIAVIDGRQKISDGATLEEAAKVMLKLGCVEAVNLDGGGSSAINILGLTLNRPSDGKERPVANGLVLMGTKLESTTALLKLKMPEKLIIGTAKTLFVVDAAGKRVPNAEVLWSAGGDGWVDQGGLARPIQNGKMEVAAYVRGQLLRASLDVVEPEKKAAPNSRLTRSKAASRTKRGRG
jgi:hypothetical protein